MVLLALKVAYHPGLHEVKKLPGTLFFLSVGVPLCLVEDIALVVTGRACFLFYCGRWGGDSLLFFYAECSEIL